MSSVQASSVGKVARKEDTRGGKTSNNAFVRGFKNAHELNNAFSRALHHCRHVHSAGKDARGKTLIRLCGGNTYPSSQERTRQIGTPDLPQFLRDLDGRRIPVTKKDRELWSR